MIGYEFQQGVDDALAQEIGFEDTDDFYNNWYPKDEYPSSDTKFPIPREEAQNLYHQKDVEDVVIPDGEARAFRAEVISLIGVICRVYRMECTLYEYEGKVYMNAEDWEEVMC